MYCIATHTHTHTHSTGDLIINSNTTLEGVLSSARFFHLMPMVEELERKIRDRRYVANQEHLNRLIGAAKEC
jgi:hypothetical protein